MTFFVIDEACVWPGDLEIALAAPNINQIFPPLLPISFLIEESRYLSCLKVKNLDECSEEQTGQGPRSWYNALSPNSPVSIIISSYHLQADTL